MCGPWKFEEARGRDRCGCGTLRGEPCLGKCPLLMRRQAARQKFVGDAIGYACVAIVLACCAALVIG